MATFPALRPGTRTYIAASYPGAVHTAYGGQESRVRTSNASSGARLRLQFPGISETQMLEIASHYAGQRGRFYPFQLSDEALSGVADPDALTPAGYQWIYAGSPKITDISIGTAAAPSCVHDVELELELVPEVSTFAGGARWVAAAAIRSGIATNGNISLAGASWIAAATIGGGIHSSSTSGAGWTAAAAIAGGAATDGNIALSGASWSAAAVIGGGGTVLNASVPGAAWSAAAAIAGGVTTDPNFSNVSLLLHMDGSNGSTSFPDSSSNTLTITRAGSAQISTTQSKFGGASVYFDGSVDCLSASYSSKFDLVGSAFTIECWIFLETLKTNGTRIAAAGGGLVGYNSTNGIHWLMQLASDDKLELQVRNTSSWGFVRSVAAVAANTWTHVAVCVNGSTGYAFVNGSGQSASLGTLQRPTTNPTLNIATIPGENGAIAYALRGYIDDFRITKGVARYTANFTPPTAAFPDS